MPHIEQDWAALCREYRDRLGLKQEAMADDFNVDQSLISRWERGQREPSRLVKQAIQNEMLAAGQTGPDQSLQLLLEQSGSAVAVWDRKGTLRGFSRRFEHELRCVIDFPELRHRHSSEILGGSTILNRALRILEEHGFFDGAVVLASFSFPPFLQSRRRQAGGLVTASTFPIRLTGGETAMLCVYDHDTLAPDSPDPDMLTVSWVMACDGHAGSTREKL